MTGIRSAIADYLAVRRALGYKLEDHGWLLADFATFLEDRDAGTITTEFALAWATRPGNALPSWWAARLRVVRGFARHVKAFDPATEIPPIGLLACSNRRAMPYVYADAEVWALMSATTSLRPALHAATYRTLLGLLAVSGMRLGEVIRLDRPDLDTAEAIVTIRDSKFGKSRQVPLHPSTLDALAEYALVRPRHGHIDPTSEEPTDMTDSQDPALFTELMALLRTPSTCYITTLMPDGSPQLTQTWVDTAGEHILINSVAGYQKLRNVERDPRVAVV